MCDKAYQVLHDPSRHWRDAPIEWRRAYAVAAYYRASLLDDAAEAVRQADLGLMLGDTRHRSQLLELIEALDPEPDQYAGPAWRTPMPNPCARSVSSSQDILRLSSPSISTFKNECFDVATPAVLEGVIEHWPALRKWSDLGYLNHVAGRRLVPVGGVLIIHYGSDERCVFCSGPRSGDSERCLSPALLAPGRVTGGVQLGERRASFWLVSYRPLARFLDSSRMHHSGGPWTR